jgi:hypothetical protein
MAKKAVRKTVVRKTVARGDVAKGDGAADGVANGEPEWGSG